MFQRKNEPMPLDKQMSNKVKADKKEKPKNKKEQAVVSTGSTLLDLAISGGVFHKGGIPGGVLVEIFGPSGAGKTVLLCEIAGAVQRAGGSVMFCDPEGRLNKKFASLFGLDYSAIEYHMPDTVPEVFDPIRTWAPEPKNVIHGIFADSLAALSTDLEMTSKDGDKMGQRRAKEFSQCCRVTCRELTKKKMIMVCSNQIRVNMDAGLYGQKFRTPGGEAIPFYSSIRLKVGNPTKIKEVQKVKGVEHKRVIGIETPIEVYKNSVDRPYRQASVFILFDYGIDDIRGNLIFLKKNLNSKVYTTGSTELSKSMESSIEQVEKQDLSKELKANVIELWNELESKFHKPRLTKERE